MQRKHFLARCEECPLYKEKMAPTSGPEDASVAFVSRSPGFHDVKAGRPFAGPSGQVLDYLLRRHGVSRSEIITTNVVLCETDSPPVEAINACRPRLESEIANADLIIAGGAESVKTLTGRSSISATRGHDFTRDSATGKRQRIVVTNNPAAILRESDRFPDMVRDFRDAFSPIPPPIFPEVEVIDDPATAKSVLRRWNSERFDTPLASDLEWHPIKREIFAAGFSKRGTRAVTLGKRACDDKRVKQLLRDFYERTDVQFIWHNGQADTKILRVNGIHARIDIDTFLLSYALDEYPGRHALDYLLGDIFGWPDYTPEAVRTFKKTGEIADESLPELYEYNGWDAAGTFQLYEHLDAKARRERVFDAPYRRRLLPLSRSLVDIELRGFRFDAEEAANINERFVLPRLYELEQELRELSDHPLYNPRSPKQTQAILYSEWGLKHGLKSTGKKKLAESTGKEVRLEIMGKRFTLRTNDEERRKRAIKFAQALNTFTRIDKQRGTYIEGLIKRAANDGRLYCEFNPGGTVTGRISSKSPNLQNVTREGVEGIPGIRSVFLPSDGHVILQADYSQAELRACAVLSGEPNLLSVYGDSSRSLHKERAAAFYGRNYTPEEYVKSKNINFGVTYGQSADAFAQMYVMPKQEAQAYIDSWWKEFPTLKAWTREIHKQARSKGRICSPIGHIRRFHLITKENLGDVLREAVNFLPQNIAAWLTLLSLVELNDNFGIPIIATVHDSIVVDCPVGEVGRVARTMREVMEVQAFKTLNWELPFTVDLSVGENWGALEDYALNDDKGSYVCPSEPLSVATSNDP
jgi:uracil-DNA glycosylase family 4